MATFYGDGGNNKIIKTNADTVIGRGGDDTLSGGVMIGESGNDTYYVDSFGWNDIIIEEADGGMDTVIASISYALPSNVENLTLSSSSGFLGSTLGINLARHGVGNNLRNIIHGNQYGNDLRGEGGNDFLSGGLGNDTLRGGSGEDTLLGTSLNSGFGKGEIDVMYGGTEKDVFMLGSSSQDRALYNDGDITKSGINDYALIKDLEIGKDQITLYGSASNYVLESSSILGISGTAVLLKGTSYAPNELIGVIEGISPSQLHLGSSTFSYVQ